MLRFVLALLLPASLPAGASAAGFGALPVLPVAPAARCLRATGAPGELVRWADGGALTEQATASGFGATSAIPLGDVLGCPSAAAAPGGAGVLAATLNLGDISVGVALRDPGGPWQPATRIPLEQVHDVEDLSTAVSRRGDAVVAWSESQELNRGLGARIRVARRTPGGALGEPAVLGGLHGYGGRAPTVRAALQADGTATVLWTQESDKEDDLKFAFVAVAPPGQPFGPPQRLADAVRRTPSLAVAPDGRALAVLPEIRDTLVFERPPGGGDFAPVATVDPADVLEDQVAVALRPDGAAVVSWADFDSLQVFAIRRDGPGAFGPPEPLGAVPEDPYAPALALGFGHAPGDIGGRALRAAFAGDGRPVVTWGAPRSLGTLDWVTAAAATPPGRVQALSGPLRNADSIAPVILADGTPAVAWSDVAPGGDPLLHLAPANALQAPPPPFPRITIGAVTQIRHGLVLPIRCSAACDVRASLPGGTEGSASLKAAGTSRVKLDAEYDPIEVPLSGRVPMRVLSGPPGARTPRDRTLGVRLRKPALPRVLGLTARQHGRSVVIRWHTARPVHDTDFILEALRGGEESAGDSVAGDHRTAFTLQLDDAPRTDSVRLYVLTHRDSAQRRLAVVRVR